MIAGRSSATGVGLGRNGNSVVSSTLASAGIEVVAIAQPRAAPDAGLAAAMSRAGATMAA